MTDAELLSALAPIIFDRLGIAVPWTRQDRQRAEDAAAEYASRYERECTLPGDYQADVPTMRSLNETKRRP